MGLSADGIKHESTSAFKSLWIELTREGPGTNYGKRYLCPYGVENRVTVKDKAAPTI